MKIFVGLLLLSLGLAFGAGYIALQVRQSEKQSFNFSANEIYSLKRQFREKKPVIDEINSTALFSPLAGFELLDPRMVLSPTRNSTFSTTASVFRANKFCQPRLITDPSLSKIRKWIAFQCQHITQLPAHFFDQPPFMTPFGISFASLAFTSGNPDFTAPEWLQKNIPYFHSLELASLKPILTLDPKRKILSQLSTDILLAMTSGQTWLGTEKYTLVRKNSEARGDFQKSSPTVDYLVYQRADWNQFLSRYRIETKDGQTSGCAYQDDGQCWVKTSTTEKKIQWTMGVLFLLAIGIIIFCVLQIIRTIQTQRREEERKRFALQALTHELRTPLSSLVISSEQLFNQFDSLPPSLKEPLLRMADDVQRLTRVAESSRNYLNANDSSSLISFNFVEIPSINEFISMALDRYSDKITLNPLDIDGPFKLDRYWIGTCLQNLVQNADQHGIQPIVVDLKRDNKSLIIAVSDAGEIREKKLSNLSKPFFKQTRSTGLGLGLTIVETVMAAMNSKLNVSANPTRFELRIGEIK